MNRTLLAVATLTLLFGAAPCSVFGSYGPDRSFGNAGSTSARLGPADTLDSVSSQALVRDSKGRMVLGSANADEWQIRRYTRDGELDQSFGESGTVVVDQWGGIESDWEGTANLTQIALRPDGRIVAVGFLGGINRGYERPRIAMQQLLPDGSPDESFGSLNGSRTYGSGTGAAAITLQPDGRFLVAGFTQRGSTGREISGVLFRFNADASLDREFATAGRLQIRGTASRGQRNGGSSYLLDVEVLPGGKILAAGTIRGFHAVVQLKRNGRYDRSFGRRGVALVKVEPGECACELGRAIDTDSQGRILLTGYVSPPDWKRNVYSVTMRLNAQGRLDRKFGERGIVRLARSRSTHLYDVAVDSRDGIWVTGRTKSRAGPTRMITARYLTSGRLDRAFFSKGFLRGVRGNSSAGWGLLAHGSLIFLSGRWKDSENEFVFLRKFVWR